MPRSARRKSLPSSPAKSREPTTEPHQTRKTTRTRSREPTVAPIVANGRHAKNQLDSVEEEGDTIVLRDPELAQRDISPHNNAAHEEGRRRLQSSRRVPSIRATVYDNIAPIGIRVESMIRHLTELEFRADEVLSRLDMYTTQQLLETLDDRQSLVWDDFFENASSLERVRKYYGTDDDFLEVDLLLQEMAVTNLPTAGAEHIYTKTNLALFFYRLLEAHPVELHNLLVTLTSIQAFPEVFTGRNIRESQSPVEYGGDFKYQTTSLGIDILSQCFLFKARRNADKTDFDHDKILQEIFFVEENTVRNVSLGNLSSSEQRGYIESMEDTMSNIKQIALTGEGQGVNITALEKNHSWLSFVAEALAWVRIRVDQIDSAIRQEGGARAIKRSLQQSSVAINSRANKGRSRPSRADEDFAGKISFLRSIDENLNAGEVDPQAPEEEVEEDRANAEEVIMQEAVRQPSSTRILQEILPKPPRAQEQVQDTTQGQDQDQDQNNLVNDNEPNEQELPDSAQSPSELSAIRPTQETSAVLHLIQRQAKEGNKENSPPAEPNRAPDRRTTAVRSTSTIPDQARPIQKGKRRHKDDDDDDPESDEDAFESDQRQNKRPRPHSGKAAEPVNRIQPTGSDMFLANTDDSDSQSRPSSQPPQQRPQTNNNQLGSSTQPAPTSAQVRTQARSQSANSSRAPSSSLPQSSFHAEYMRIKQHARANASFAAAVAPQTTIRLPQTRRAWTADEIERLMFLIGKYGCAWSTIKKADEQMENPQLLERTQVQLKDKARNMKVDFLKAEVQLPEGLEGATMSKSHKQMLKAMNIAYPGEEIDEN